MVPQPKKAQKPYVRFALELLQAAHPGGLARQEVLRQSAIHVHPLEASTFGRFLGLGPENEQAIFERQVAIVGREIDSRVKKGELVYSQADGLLYWHDRDLPATRYVACADVKADVEGFQRTLAGIPELSASIMEQGQLTPILLVTSGDGVYHLAAGHRRLAAHQWVDQPIILARIWTRDPDEVEVWVHLLRINENLWTQPLTDAERAHAEAGRPELLARITARSQERMLKGTKTLSPGDGDKVSKPRKRAPPSVEQLAKEMNISRRAAQNVIDLARLEDRLRTRAKYGRVRGEPKTYRPGHMVLLIAQKLLTEIQGAPDDLTLRKAALRTIKEYERQDMKQWLLMTEGGTKPTPADAAKEKEKQDNHDSDAVRVALLAQRGRPVPEIARKLHLTIERTNVLIEDGKQVMLDWADLILAGKRLPSVNEVVYDLGHAHQDGVGMPHVHRLACTHCGQMEVQTSEVVT